MQTQPPAPALNKNQSVGLISIPAHIVTIGLSLIALSLAFPSPGWGWISHLALAPIVIVACKSRRPLIMLLILYIGLSLWWLWMIRWLSAVTVGGYIGLSFVMALYPTIGLLCTRLLYRRFNKLLIIIFPCCWVAWEFLRGYWPSGGFGWLALSHSQAPWLPEQGVSYLIQVSDLFGEYAVSFLVCMTNGLIADLLLQPIWNKKPNPQNQTQNGQPIYAPLHPDPQPQPRPTPNRWLQASIFIWAASFMAAMAYGVYRVSTTGQHLADHGLNVGVIQTNEPVSNRADNFTKSAEEFWAELLTLSRDAANSEPTPDLLAWPESAVPAALNPESLAFYKTQKGPFFTGRTFYVDQTRDISKELGLPMLVGAPAVLTWGIKEYPDGRYRLVPGPRYNSAYLVTPDKGISPEYFNKMHRVPFGEYIPWVDTNPWLKEIFIKYFSPYEYDYTIQPGKEAVVFDIKPRPVSEPAGTQPGAQSGTQLAQERVYRVVTPICFEDSVARATRNLVYAPDGTKQADMIVNLTNDGWYPDTDQCLQHFQIAVLRSVENRVPSARAVNTGVSGFIDSAGRVTVQVEKLNVIQSVSGFAVAKMVPDNRSTLWGYVGVMPTLVLFFFVLGLVVLDQGIKWAFYQALKREARRAGVADSKKNDDKSTDVRHS